MRKFVPKRKKSDALMQRLAPEVMNSDVLMRRAVLKMKPKNKRRSVAFRKLGTTDSRLMKFIRII
jgi:hypothetical protein